MTNLQKVIGVKISAVIIFLCLACPFAFAADVGTVTYVEGRVDTLSPGSDMGMPLRQGDSIAVGDALRTKSNSKLEVTFNDKSVLRVAQNSKVVVKDYQLDASNRRQTANILLERGKARTIIAKMPRSADFIISTPNASGSVKGSDIFTSYQAGNSGMLVAEGKLSVVNTLKPEPAVIIPAGSAVVVSLEETPKGPRQYFETEKKMYEQDTEIPATIARTPGSSEIKGAIAKLSGDVKVTFKNTGETRPASINDILEAGDTIVTGDNGMVEIKFDNGNGINLKPNSDIKINSLVMDAKTGEYENLFESTK
ncbi:MAG TPA: FecR domain-containing protein, partial [Candidatus Omnitrophota bacterium]|nr:FecR domain-containing protein [Candidatus Omnitrophota bacterium]